MQHKTRRNTWLALVLGLTLGLTGCASWFSVPQAQKRNAASAMEYLYPDKATEAQAVVASTVQLNVPVRVGIAFAPSANWDGTTLPEAERLRLLDKVKEAFRQRPYIGAIEAIPAGYLQARGGFTNLESAARMFNVDVVALLSYDQVQFNDANRLSLLYWTLVGAYLVKGDQYDIHTLIDASVFDVKSHQLLFRAPGASQIQGKATLVGFGEAAREARVGGFNQALDALIPQLGKELDTFRERIKGSETVKVQYAKGYSGGSLDWAGLLLAVALLGVAVANALRR